MTTREGGAAVLTRGGPSRNPDRLDRPLRISTSLAGTMFAALIAVVAAAILWSCVSTAPVKIEAQGILLTRLGVVDITADANGRVVSFEVAVGDHVAAGQVVARINQPQLSDELQSKLLALTARKAEQAQTQLLASRDLEAAERQRGMRRRAIDVRLASLGQRLAATREIESNTAALFAAGVSTRMRLLEATNDRSRTENELNDAQSQLLSLQADAEERRSRDERDALKAQIAVDSTEREIAVIRESLERANLVKAPATGMIAEINLNLGEQVQAGMPLLRMLPGESGPDELKALFYVSGGAGRRVRPGMDVQIVPATARQQRDGFIEGQVVSVSELPATRESIARILKNTTLVDQLTRAGPPYQAVVSLGLDPRSPSGFRWSTGRGTDLPLGAGTLLSGKIVIDRVPIIGMVVPGAEAAISHLRSAAVP